MDVDMKPDERSLIRMHPLTLRFDGDLESDFQRSAAQSVITKARVALISGFALYAIFGLLDAWLAPSVRDTLWLIRYGAVCPFIALAFALTFVDTLKSKIQLLLAATALAGGIGIIGMVLSAPAPVSYLYYAGLLLVVIYMFAFMGLRFVYGIAMASLTLLLYSGSLPFQSGLTSAIIINNLFFLVTAIILSATAAYASERTTRKLFVQNLMLNDLNDLISEKNQQLAELNKAYSRQNDELSAANGRLAILNDEIISQNVALVESNEALSQSIKRVETVFAALSDALPGTVINQSYRLEKKIGSGGFGTVYRATEIATDRRVAVKILRPNSSDDPLVSLERFRVESVTSMKVRHPHCVEVFDFGISEGQIAYIVMEYLEGMNLSEQLKTDGYPNSAQSIHILLAVARALSAAHRQGVVHRDVKPSNVFLTGPNMTPGVKLLDFGIAKLVGVSQPALHPPLTREGELLGTPMYMSPEQIMGEEIGPPADVFSFGVMAYELFAGRRPWVFETGDTTWGVVMKRLNSPPVDLSHWTKLMSPSLNSVVMACLNREASNRPMANELISILSEAKSLDLSVKRLGPRSDLSSSMDTTLIDEIDKTQKTE